jgi:polysaccharide export outer membrane protein
MRVIDLGGLAGVALMLLTACAGPAAVTPEPARVNAEATVAEDYKLGVGDKVRVIVYNEETLSGEFQVGASGKIALPLIGDVDVIGRSTAEVATAIQTSLSSGYLKDPRVNVEVLSYRPFFILGEVKTPAQYPFANGLTVLNAVATANGFTPRADRKHVYIRRSGEDREKVYLVTPDLKVFPGDTLRIGERLF